MQDIKILKIRPIFNGEGRNLKAFCDIQIGEIVINEWRIFHRPGQMISIVSPQTTWKDKDGRVQYRSIVSIPSELKQQIDAAIISTWKREEEKESEKENQGK